MNQNKINNKYNTHSPVSQAQNAAESCCPLCHDLFATEDMRNVLVEIVNALKAPCPSSNESFAEDTLIDAIKQYASTIACGRECFVEVPLARLQMFLDSALKPFAATQDIPAIIDGESAVLNLTGFCTAQGFTPCALYKAMEL